MSEIKPWHREAAKEFIDRFFNKSIYGHEFDLAQLIASHDPSPATAETDKEIVERYARLCANEAHLEEADTMRAILTRFLAEVRGVDADAVGVAELEEELAWIDDHLYKNADTKATRAFITDRTSKEAQRLLRICDLLDAAALVSAQKGSGG